MLGKYIGIMWKTNKTKQRKPWYKKGPDGRLKRESGNEKKSYHLDFLINSNSTSCEKVKNSAWRHSNAVLKTFLFNVGELQMAGTFAASNPSFLTPRTSSSSRGAALHMFFLKRTSTVWKVWSQYFWASSLLLISSSDISVPALTSVLLFSKL